VNVKATRVRTPLYRELEKKIVELQYIRGCFVTLHDEVKQRLKRLQNLPTMADRHRHAEMDDCVLTLRQIERGVHPNEGMSPELSVLVLKHQQQFARPGLATIDRELQRVRGDLQREEARINRWPTKDTTHPYRLVGERHLIEGRYVTTGTVLQLNEQQAAALADRFEAVEEGQAPRTNSAELPTSA
jgi:hypothetical protein